MLGSPWCICKGPGRCAKKKRIDKSEEKKREYLNMLGLTRNKGVVKVAAQQNCCVSSRESPNKETKKQRMSEGMNPQPREMQTEQALCIICEYIPDYDCFGAYFPI